MEPLSGESGNIYISGCQTAKKWLQWSRSPERAETDLVQGIKRVAEKASMEPLSGESGNLLDDYPESEELYRFNGAALRRERKPDRPVNRTRDRSASMEPLSGESGNAAHPRPA